MRSAGVVELGATFVLLSIEVVHACVAVRIVEWCVDALAVEVVARFVLAAEALVDLQLTLVVEPCFVAGFVLAIVDVELALALSVESRVTVLEAFLHEKAVVSTQSLQQNWREIDF